MRTKDGHSRRTRIKGLGLHAGLLLLVVSVALLAAGCRIQIGLDTVVKENGSGTFGLRLAADKEIQDLMAQQGGGEDLFSGLKEGMPEGWTTEEGTDPDGTKWVKATVAFKDQDSATRQKLIEECVRRQARHSSMESSSCKDGMVSLQFSFSGLEGHAADLQAAIRQAADASAVNIFFNRPGGLD